MKTTTACSRDFSLGCASTLTALSRRGRLLSATFVAAAIAPSLGYETTPAPAWFADLSPAERAVLSPRYTGGPAAADAAPPPVAAAPPTLSAEEQQDAEELWFFDLTGHLLVRGKSQGVVSALQLRQPR